MKQIEEIIRNTTEQEQEKVDWTKAWSTKYPVLATYQKEVDIPKYAAEIRRMFTELQADYNYSEQDAMLVLKDILAHEYMDSEISYGDFFRQAPAMNPNREKITGVVCGVRVENVENSLMRDIRYLDKLVDELAKGKAMEKILRE